MSMMKYKCKFCNETFVFEKKQQAGAHVTNCSMNPNKKLMIEKSLITKNQIKNEKTLNCTKCGEEYKIYVTEHIFSIGNYPKHCSYKCSNSRNLSEESRIKISVSLKNKPPRPKKVIKDVVRFCVNCNKAFECKETSTQKFCSYKCAGSVGGRNSKQGKRSKNEILLFELCNEEYSNVLSNENMFNGWDADIILNDHKMAIMWNGKWHYEKLTKKHSLKQVRNRDYIKIKEIKKLGYEPYIIRDMGSYNPEFVENEFEKLKKYIKNKNIL